MQLAATTTLGDLRPLVLGDHSLELAQQLILRRAGTLGLLREDHLDTRPLELLEQQHLIRIPAREPIRRVTQQHDRTASRPRGRATAPAPGGATRPPRRLHPRTPDLRGQTARDQSRAHAARRSGFRSSARDAGGPRTPERRSPRSSPAARSRPWRRCCCRSLSLPSLWVTRRRSGAKITYACASRGSARRSPTNSISTRLATGPLAGLIEIRTNSSRRRRAQRLTARPRALAQTSDQRRRAIVVGPHSVDSSSWRSLRRARWCRPLTDASVRPIRVPISPGVKPTRWRSMTTSR